MRKDLPKVAVVAAIGLLSAGCKSPLQATMESWMGQREERLLEAWGAPDRTQTLSDGSRIHTWVDTWYSQFGQPVRCRKTFRVNSQGVVVHWSYSGAPSAGGGDDKVRRGRSRTVSQSVQQALQESVWVVDAG